MTLTQTTHGAAAHESFIARTNEDLDQVYQLRHACYLRKGSIEARPDRRFRDEFDQMPNSFSFLVRSQAEEALATVRISVVRDVEGWRDSPGQHVFGDHPALRSMAREGYVEASRLCFGPQARRDAFVRLVGNMAALADLYDAGWLMACPRMEHTGTYIRMFGFKPMAEPRQYFGVNFQTQLLGVRREELKEHIGAAKPLVAAWRDALTQMTARSAFPTMPAALIAA